MYSEVNGGREITIVPPEAPSTVRKRDQIPYEFPGRLAMEAWEEPGQDGSVAVYRRAPILPDGTNIIN